MRIRLIILCLLFANFALAQSNAGGIDGKVTFDGKPLDFATVRAIQGGLVKGGAKTDENGNFRIKPLDPGEYDLVASYVGKGKKTIKGIRVYNSQMSTENVELKPESGGKGGKVLGTVKIRQKKLIDDANPGGSTNFKSGKELAALPTQNTAKMISTLGGVSSNGGESAGSFSGGRSSNTLYVIDGMPILGSRGTNLAPGMFDGLQAFRTGMPAKQGNATGAVVQLQTRGPSPFTVANLTAQTSVDGYFTNLVSFDISGPLYNKKDTIDGVPSLQTKLGYILNIQGRYNKDSRPSYYGYNTIKPSVLEGIQANPLVSDESGGFFLEAAELVTLDDIENTRNKENGENWGVDYLGKLDYQPTDKINVQLGTYFNYTRSKGWSLANSMFAPERNSINTNYSARAFVRLTQKLGKSERQKEIEREEAKKNGVAITPSIFSNAFYQIQASYQREYSYAAHPVHGNNLFDYGYIGKFEQNRTPFYIQDTAAGGFQGWKYLGDFNDGLDYTAGGKNPLLENYTNSIYNDPRYDVSNLGVLQALGGLRNGDAPNTVYGMYFGAGDAINGYSFGQEDKFNLSLDASFDIEQGKGKNSSAKSRSNPIVHQIEFGMGYQQRANRGYGTTGEGTWNLMRLLTNRHIAQLDIENPIFRVGGQDYTLQDVQNGVVQFSEFDTINYNRIYSPGDHSRFDYNLRQKLFGNPLNTSIIDIDALDPSTFSLDMFSPDDLLTIGANVVGWRGYDHLGNIQRNQPSFSDFWTAKDDRGDFLRPIGAYTPNYMYGYIQDRFKFKDIKFNIGVRIDRFDANQNVLRDPYSFFARRDVGDLTSSPYRVATDENGTSAPDPITSGYNADWVPYVDNNQSANPTIVGYRDGDVWFDPFGREISDPTVLSGQYANGLPIQPYLVDPSDSIKSSSYNVNGAFTDYRPDLSVSPRLQFVFPIGDKSQFYGNYGIVTQTPSSRNRVTPDDYYFLQERQNTLDNANLRMERSIDYTLGYEQALGKRSTVGIEVYYRERKDQIQLQRFLLAYPVTYQSYGNRDFSTTKGFTFNYSLKRVGPFKFDIGYTLQFAEGTGSTTTSAAALFSTSQPNLRTLFPMSFDSRHAVNVNIDYRYRLNHNRGPQIGSHYILNGFSANMLLQANSGRPYTRSSIATPIVGGNFTGTPMVGTLNGSRLPWYSDVSLRLTKQIALYKKVKEGENSAKSKRPSRTSLSVYSFINNLLNAKNVLGVYNFTGLPDDDGYLESPQGIQDVTTSNLFPQSFTDLYRTRMQNPFNVGMPRRVSVGFTINF